jgi:anti-sigma regulatory factor (Ser/Thr protein kinase)
MEAQHPVRLTVPAEPGSVRLARLVAAGVAADAGLSIDDTEDLRIAVSELVALLIEGAPADAPDVVIAYRRSPGEVHVSGESVVGPSPDAVDDDLAFGIVEVMVDSHEFSVDGNTRRFQLVKRARTTV